MDKKKLLSEIDAVFQALDKLSDENSELIRIQNKVGSIYETVLMALTKEKTETKETV